MPKIIDKDEKKRSIAIAAINLIAENGLQKTSMESIAKAAKVGKGTVYLYFSTKEEIVLEIWDYVYKLIDNGKEKQYKNTKSPSEKIAIFFDFSLIVEEELITKLLKIFANNMAVILTSSHEGLRSNYELSEENDLSKLKDILQEGIALGEFKNFNVDTVGHIYLNMFKGFLINAICKNISLEDMKKDFDKQKHFLLELIQKDIK
ncbi:TetR/AcrR family transcriptional regulator [Sulfurospirillum arcachonense]|uniref:TetR/AcrR family transcriptional regulator n=1 Tax=Sulfurospirillum arcachonense TaxID=57666 RepID=UPI000469402F|nr:TetR/AcrR family transcriptional regulator [Sulfurospirillum arcachonense]